MPRPRRLFLHVGLPKTATTSWQVWWDTHRTELLAQSVDYPLVETITFDPNHSAIARSMEKGDTAPLTRVLEGARAETMLLSSESFSMTAHAFSPSAIAALRKALGDISVTCLVVFREPKSWLRSLHAQALLNDVKPRPGFGVPLTLEEFSAQPRILRMLDHAEVAARIEAAYGGPCLQFCHEDSPFAQVCSAVGIDVMGLPEPGWRNASVSPSMTELMRQVNGLTSDDNLRHGIIWLFRHAEPSTHTRLHNTGAPDPALWAAIRAVVAGLKPVGDDQIALARTLAELAQQEIT